MDGFVQVERETHDHDDNHSIADAVMQGFSEGALPISATLAAEFGIFDRWHTAFPGPSWPNHMFSRGRGAGDGSRRRRGRVQGRGGTVAAISCPAGTPRPRTASPTRATATVASKTRPIRSGPSSIIS